MKPNFEQVPGKGSSEKKDGSGVRPKPAASSGELWKRKRALGARAEKKKVQVAEQVSAETPEEQISALERRIGEAELVLRSKIFSMKHESQNLINMVEERVEGATDDEWEDFVREGVWPRLNQIHGEIAELEKATELKDLKDALEALRGKIG